MTGNIDFETPENIRVSYQTAGLGTRFVAWFIDKIVMILLGFFLFIVFLIIAASTEGVFRQVVEPLREMAKKGETSDPEEMHSFFLYVMGIWAVIWSMSNFLYFGCSELLMRGQTIGKRWCAIRVVKADGFSLDPSSIFVRTIFRVIDHLPPMWLVPLLSTKAQRFGDMVAGTVVIVDELESMTILREALLQRPLSACRFRFDATTLKRVRESDINAIERILERWKDLDTAEQDALLDQLVPPLVNRLETEPPDLSERLQFLQDLLSAEYRSQSRKLG